MRTENQFNQLMFGIEEVENLLVASLGEVERLRETLEKIEQQLEYGQVDTALHIARIALSYQRSAD